MTWTTRRRSDIGALRAVTAGAGPHIVLLHGVGLRAEAWGAQLDALADVAHVIALDMPGHGDSVMPVPHMGFEDFKDVAAAAIAALDGPAVLAGHSMGAMLALELAADMPDRVCGVAALNAVFERSDAAAHAVQARAAQLDGQNPTDPSRTLERWFGACQSPERNACRDWLLSVDSAAYKCAYTAFAESGSPQRRALEHLQCPALFMTGSLDPNSTPDMSRAMADLAPYGKAVIVEGSAHMMPMTHSDEVNRALRGLLQDARQ
ncbi:alpha/beta fold hydrolase [Tateyamaria sp. syn59]|uniref:alpha/beta fold hydrolase n=1 Tax=Tateyamaria sp. syn59 TaxID=2576942 RepID=UPI0011BF948C|nr:alpha/beta hydrolase [Tateyamaria sp. syn59]